MKLTEAEKISALWIRLHAHLSEKLEIARKKNDGDLTPDQTAKLRGRISALKEILALSETEPVQAGNDE